MEHPPTSPFARMRVRDLVGLFLLFAVAALGLMLLVSIPLHRRPDERLLMVVLTATMALPVIVKARVSGLRWRRVFGALPERRELPLVTAIVPVALLMMASVCLVYVPLSYVAPDFVRRMFLEDSFFDATTIGQWLLLAFGAAVLAPVVEELLFRGVIMQRWAYRWGTRTGVVASSALFAVGHGEWFGHFVFGVAMSLLYLRTRRLWVPIVAHGLNNFVLTLPILWQVMTHAPVEPPETLAMFRERAWLGIPMLAAALLLGWLYLRMYWPAGSIRATIEGPVPYDARDGVAV